MFRRRISHLLITLLFFLLITGFQATLAQAGTPEQSVRSLLDQIRQIDPQDHPSAELKAANQKLYASAIQHLHVAEVSRKALGKHWKKLDQDQRGRFVQLLSRLFQHVAFPNSAKFFKSLKIDFGKSEIESNRARVPITVHHDEQGEVGIDFILQPNSEEWKVTDVVLDGVSMRNNLRAQFLKILKKDSYLGLVRRMKKKLKESQ